MSAWVALLRGINVGGINIKSVDLARAFEAAGFGAVKTVLATGNVLFEAPASDPEALRADVEGMLSSRFGYDAKVVLETPQRLLRLASGYPYAEGPGHHAYVVFTSAPAFLAPLLTAARERGVTLDEPGAGGAGGADGTGSTGSEGTRGTGEQAADRPAAPLNDGEERVALGDGVLYWACPRGASTSTPFSKLTSAAAHKRSLTTRNLNTVRKLLPAR